MSLKSCLLSILSLFSVVVLHAQDKIYKVDGSIIDAKVKAINGNTITYRSADNHDGPDYKISKKDVNKIVYQNGTMDSFEGTVKNKTTVKTGKSGNGKTGKQFGDNILSIIPAAYTVDMNGSMSDPGLGICYERLLDKNGHIGFTLTGMINFLGENDFRNYRSFTSSSYVNTSASGYTSVLVMPGIKLYPAANTRMLRYSLGLSFFTLFGDEPFYVYDARSLSVADYRYTMYGAMITNAINVSLTKHMYMAMEMNGGVPFSDNRRAKDGGDIDVFITPMMQFLLKVGYRF